jgi:hypothetical protein
MTVEEYRKKYKSCYHCKYYEFLYKERGFVCRVRNKKLLIDRAKRCRVFSPKEWKE